MTLREFLKLYNFREIVRDKENTQIIRIYTDWPTDWFEFGVNSWKWPDESTDILIKKFINKEVLNREVVSINYDEANEIFCIHTEEETPKK